MPRAKRRKERQAKRVVYRRPYWLDASYVAIGPIELR